jgi:two-component system chemotaxis sensor kinase CheA
MSDIDQEDLQSSPPATGPAEGSIIETHELRIDMPPLPASQSRPAAEPESEAEILASLIKDFVIESRENLDQFDRHLVSLEQDPASQSTLVCTFRSIHSIKGTCGFFGLKKLESVSHTGESLLIRLRDGKLRLTPEILTALTELSAAIRQLLDSIEAEGREDESDYSSLIRMLTRLQQEPAAPSEPGTTGGVAHRIG